MCHDGDEDDDHGDDDDDHHHILHILQGASVFYHLPTNVYCIMDCGGIAAGADPGERPPPPIF